MIRPWLFEFFPAFEGNSPAGDYAWYLDQWVRTEAAGFEGIFFSEHHFRPRLYSPSPNLLIAAVAPLTRTLRLGIMGSVVPLYEPWRLAEEYGMLDQPPRRWLTGLSGATAAMAAQRGYCLCTGFVSVAAAG